MGDQVTLSELARRLGCNRSYVHKLKTRGVLAFDQNGLIDEDAARAAIENNSDPAKEYMREVNAQQRERAGGSAEAAAPSTASANYMRAKTMRAAFDAKLAEMEYRERRGELVEAAGVSKTVTDAASIIGAYLDRIPDTLASRVAAEPDVGKCHALLRAEVDLMLSELTALCERFAHKAAA